MSFHPSLYDESFFWKNLLIAVISVRTCQHCRRTEAVGVCVVCSNCVFVCEALSPVHPAAVRASLAGDALRRQDNEKRSAVQVTRSLLHTLGPCLLILDVVTDPRTSCHMTLTSTSMCYRISSSSKPKVEGNPEEGPNEDEDVQMEKARVKEALTCQSCEEVSRPLFELSRCLSGGLVGTSTSSCQTFPSLHCVCSETAGGRE